MSLLRRQREIAHMRCVDERGSSAYTSLSGEKIRRKSQSEKAQGNNFRDFLPR